jgi:leucyl aminopeptidase
MNIELRCTPVGSCRTAALIVGCWEDEAFVDPQLEQLNTALSGGIFSLYAQRSKLGETGNVAVIPTCGRVAAERIVVVGLGPQSDITAARIRAASGVAVQAVRRLGLAECASALAGTTGLPEHAVECVVEGALLGNYRFDQYREPKEHPLREMSIICLPSLDEKTGAARIERTKVICRWVHYARDLVSHPGNVATPAYLAARALEVAGRFALQAQVLDRTTMEELGMGGVVGVGKGGREAPCFVVLKYQGPQAPRRPTVLVGKGVTFDTGGISLKPRESMERMKDDMAGAATVLAVIAAAAELALPVHLVVLLPLAENMPDGAAYKPGDILRTLAGKTVEIVNTDAEGRLLLADALAYAVRLKPAAIVDLATLTGACMVALGTVASGVMGNDRKLLQRLSAAGEATGERLWELPVWDDYGEAMKSDIADLKNSGGPHGGAVTAGWFLKQFVGTTSWAHIDIAGTAWEEKGVPICPKGATGVGVRLLLRYLQS